MSTPIEQSQMRSYLIDKLTTHYPADAIYADYRADSFMSSRQATHPASTTLQ